jgi:hypothetical protein
MAFVKLLNGRGINTEYITKWKSNDPMVRIWLSDGSFEDYAPEDWESIETKLFPRRKQTK